MPGDKLTGAEPVERQELSERLLGLIGAYEMGAALNAQDLHINTPPCSAPRRPQKQPSPWSPRSPSPRPRPVLLREHVGRVGTGLSRVGLRR